MTVRVDHRAIRHIRRSLDLTQLQLANSIGRSASWLSLVESGLGPTPDKESLEALAQALHVPFSTVIREEGSHA